jgi:hypothetical protein
MATSPAAAKQIVFAEEKPADARKPSPGDRRVRK